MPSTVIRSFSYDSAAQRLLVVFTTGRRYSYHGVPHALYDEMRAAFSKGEFFNARIRDRFAFTRDD
jgi:lysyl-tRNA synthetase class 2